MFDGGEQLQQLMIRNSSSSSPASPAARTSLTLPSPFNISSPNNFHHHHHVSSFFDPAPPHASFLQYPPAPAASPHDLQPRKLDSGGLGMNSGCMEDQPVHHHHPWSTDELVALFRIRSSFYNWFPQFTWEHVSRKMAELGYKRSADKCKEKFELESRSSSCFNNNNNNASTTTTTTAPASADNNNYRIFTELDELICHGDDDHNRDHHHPHDHADHDHTDDDDDEKGDNDDDDDDDQQKHMIPPAVVHTKPNKPTDHQKLVMTSSTADKDNIMMGQDLEQDTQNNGATATADHHALVNSNDGKLELDQNKNIEEGVKRKRREEEEEEEEDNCTKSKKKMKKVEKDQKVDHNNKFEILKGLCEEMVKKLMAQQEEMHNKLIQDMVKIDEEKVKRDEAWKKQEMERMKKELDARAKEQQIAGERQTTLLNFLSKLAAASSTTDHHPTANNPPSTSSSSSSSLAVAQNPSTTIMAHTQQDQKPDHHHHHERDGKDGRVHTSTSSSNLSDPQLPKTSNQNPNTAVTAVHHDHHQQKEDHHGGKRWPRDEVLALINIRCTLSSSSTNDQDQTKDNAGSRAPLWERISQGMLQMGYKRSAKRCKEKWENINKYFRKTKDSSKKRSLDSRTCPYFHQLSALYNQGKLSLPENPSDQPAGGDGDVQSHQKHVADDQPAAAGFDFEL